MTANNNGDDPPEGKPPTDITDIAQLQEQVATLLERINSDRHLALAAAANPLLALEELGYRLAPSVRHEIERRSRYTRRQLVRLEALRAEFARLVPNFPLEDVDLLSAAQVRRLLSEVLDLPDERIPRDLDIPPRPAPDPLAPLADAHPVMPTLLGLRDIERRALRFASAERYRELRSGKRKLPIVALAGKVANRQTRGAGGDLG
jgi:hypothetical protein